MCVSEVPQLSKATDASLLELPRDSSHSPIATADPLQCRSPRWPRSRFVLVSRVSSNRHTRQAPGGRDTGIRRVPTTVTLGSWGPEPGSRVRGKRRVNIVILGEVSLRTGAQTVQLVHDFTACPALVGASLNPPAEIRSMQLAIHMDLETCGPARAWGAMPRDPLYPLYIGLHKSGSHCSSLRGYGNESKKKKKITLWAK